MARAPSREEKPTSRELHELGRKWLRYIREEAASDRLRSPQIPRSEAFLKSFSYKVVEGSLEITSDWPWFELLFDGTDGPYRMKWLTRSAGVHRIPFRRPDGTVVFRTAPLTAADAWVHPGVARHTFVQRAYERAFGEWAAATAARILEEAFR